MYEFEKKKLYHYLGEGLYELLKKHSAILAGGAVTSLFCNREIEDLDIYFRSENSVIDFLCDVWKGDGWVTTQTKKATLFVSDKIKLQSVHFDYFKTAHDVFKTFDFTVCMGAYDFKTEEFILHNDFLKHNSQRLLKYNSFTAFPIISLLRVQKYKEKGYTISKPEFLRIILSCMNLNINTFEEFKEQIGGMYGVNYDKLFDDIKDEKFDLQKAIDKIADLSINDEYFEHFELLEIDDLDDLLENISSKPTKYFQHKDKFYKINYQGLLDESEDIPDNNIEITADEYFNDNKFYKFVEKRDDCYFSFYDSDFEYKIGEIVEAEGETDYEYLNHKGNLHFSELKSLRDSVYADENNAVVIEVKIKPEDFTGVFGHIMARKCEVIREVPKNEYEKYL